MYVHIHEYMSSFQSLNRLVVKADQATIRIPELEFEIPPCTQKGSITTVESIIRTSVDELERNQLMRKVWLLFLYACVTSIHFPLMSVVSLCAGCEFTVFDNVLLSFTLGCTTSTRH